MSRSFEYQGQPLYTLYILMDVSSYASQKERKLRSQASHHHSFRMTTFHHRYSSTHKLGKMIVESIINYVLDRRFLYQILGTLIVYVAFKFLNFLEGRAKLYKILEEHGIPGPKPSLISGNIDAYRQKELAEETAVEYRKKYGKFYGFYAGDEPSVVITDLDMLKSIFLEDKSKILTERTRTFIDQPVMQSVLFARYHRWKMMRKILAPHFRKYTARGESTTQFIDETVRLLIEYIEKKLTYSGSGKVDINVFQLMKSTTLNLISSMAIKLPNLEVKEGGENVRSLDEFLAMCDRGLVVLAAKLPIFLPLIEFLATHFEYNKTMTLVRSNLNKSLDKGIQRLRNGLQETEDDSTNKHQLFDLLIELHHKGQLTRGEVLGNAEAILLAGYDTTSTTLTYIFWVMAKHPDVQEQLREDLTAHGVESKFLHQVINETMRLYPAVTSFATRIPNEDLSVGPITIPKGVRIVYNSWLMNRDAELWTEPEKFDASRFHEDNAKNIHPCAFAPFGLGDRKCLGFQLATLEMKMIICDLLLRYRLKLKSPQQMKLISMPYFLTKPKEDVIVEVIRL